jgi:adenylate cyclase class 2
VLALSHRPASALETEVKFHAPDLPDLRARLLAIGAHSSGRALEVNIRFDDGDRRLLRANWLLRLRLADKATLTYKSVPVDSDPAFKQLHEIEVVVDDFDATQRILVSLGFRPEQTYEKWRETLVLDQTIFCLDALPFGNFLEIEGSKDAIVRFAERLGLVWSRRIVLNYLEMFDLIRRRRNLSFRDATFANFTDSAIGCNDLLPLMEAGRTDLPPA